MSRMMVRYRVKPDRLSEHEQRIRAVFDELDRVQPQGLQYAVLRLDGDTAFVHLAVTSDDPSPLNSLEAFRQFQENVADRLEDQPTVSHFEEIGSFGIELTFEPAAPPSRSLDGALDLQPDKGGVRRAGTEPQSRWAG